LGCLASNRHYCARNIEQFDSKDELWYLTCVLPAGLEG
jgi:hypothetical protein